MKDQNPARSGPHLTNQVANFQKSVNESFSNEITKNKLENRKPEDKAHLQHGNVSENKFSLSGSGSNYWL